MLYDPKWEVPVETKSAEPWRQLLLDAAKVIEERGWCQGYFRNDAGNVCMLGAMNSVDIPNLSAAEFMRAWNAISRMMPGGDVVGWNDAAGRTKEQVLGALRVAASY